MMGNGVHRHSSILLPKGAKTMKTLHNMKRIATVICVGLLIGSTYTFAAEQAPQAIIDLAHAELVKLGTDPVIVKAVKMENAKGKTLEQIKAMDEKWKATPGVADFMSELVESECGQHLRQLQKRTPYYGEIFVMDNQGANVAMTDKTSDYWQGDEAKFIEAYQKGAGGIHISDVEFDESTQTYLVQVSLPVKDDKTVIGAMTIGIDVDIFEQQ
jgi:hypothetical protein